MEGGIHRDALAAAGSHPFANWMEQEITPLEHYIGVRRDMGDLAQRLVRTICEDCVREVRYDDETLLLSGLDPAEWRTFPFREGAGCIECGGTGYKGRTAIHELLDLTDPIREAILDKKPTSEVRGLAQSEGMQFLRDSDVDRHARARLVLHSPAGRHDVTAPVPGMHNVGNALAALAAATASGVDLPAAIAGLADARVSRWRLQLESVGDVSVLNDAYNANPTSVEAGRGALCAVRPQGGRWAVLGTMAEIGPTSADEHHRAGGVVAELGVDALAGAGEGAALGVPPLRDVLELTTLPREAWLLAAALAPIPLVLTAISRTWARRRHVDR